MREIVNLQPVSQDADPLPVAVGVCDDDDTVVPSNQVLCQVVNVEFHPARLRVEEV